MINHRGVWLPDGERHLIEWMEKVNFVVDSRPTYQYAKLEAAVRQVPVSRRINAVDVGGHAGLWSVHLARLFERVIAFEPVAAHRECYAANMLEVKQNNYTLHGVALGSAPGWVTLETGPDSSGDTAVVPSGAAPGAGRTERAAMETLDTFNLANVGLIKIDCEGYELPVLIGGEDTITRCRPVICVEQKPGHAERFGFARTQAVGWLIARGYEVVKEMSGDYIMVPA